MQRQRLGPIAWWQLQTLPRLRSIPMTASFAHSAAPAYACLMWADERNIYAQLPSVNGPYVAAFPRSSGGLAKALHHMGAVYTEQSGEPYTRMTLPPSKDLIRKGLTQNDREAAMAVLKRKEVIA